MLHGTDWCNHAFRDDPLLLLPNLRDTNLCQTSTLVVPSACSCRDLAFSHQEAPCLHSAASGRSSNHKRRSCELLNMELLLPVRLAGKWHDVTTMRCNEEAVLNGSGSY